MPHNPRLDELTRRVQSDPASIAFAALAEEYRRAGRAQEAIETCRTGLVRHPAYLSARVTLGRALIDVGELDGAQQELEYVLRMAPENLAAIRGLAEIHHRRGDLAEALEQYRAALELAHHDPEINEAVEQIARRLEAAGASGSHEEGLSFEQARDAILSVAGVGAPPGPEAEPALERQAWSGSAPEVEAEGAVESEPHPDLRSASIEASAITGGDLELDTPGAVETAPPAAEAETPAAGERPAAPGSDPVAAPGLKRFLDAVVGARAAGERQD